MNELVIDMTPTTINRTAIFHIAIDTAHALTGDAAFFRYGKQYLKSPVTERKRLDAMRDGVLRAIMRDDGLIREQWRGHSSNNARRPEARKLLFFDPLYVLFEDVRPGDLVVVLDLTPVTNPEWHNHRVCELYRLAFHRIAASGANIAAISHSTALALWANYGISLETITIVPLYLRPGVGASGYDLQYSQATSKHLLFVGSLETRKNLSGLFHAFEMSNIRNRGYKLLVVGGDANGVEKIKKDASQIPGIELLGFVSDHQLKTYYRTAAAFVYPSYLEGFGVPILEAASWGLPILTSITGATPEVAPGGSLLVDPYSVTEVSDAIREIVSISEERRKEIFEFNRKHSATYSFSRYLNAIRSGLNLHPT